MYSHYHYIGNITTTTNGISSFGDRHMWAEELCINYMGVTLAPPGEYNQTRYGISGFQGVHEQYVLEKK